MSTTALRHFWHHNTQTWQYVHPHYLVYFVVTLISSLLHQHSFCPVFLNLYKPDKLWDPSTWSKVSEVFNYSGLPFPTLIVTLTGYHKYPATPITTMISNWIILWQKMYKTKPYPPVSKKNLIRPLGMRLEALLQQNSVDVQVFLHSLGKPPRSFVFVVESGFFPST